MHPSRTFVWMSVIRASPLPCSITHGRVLSHSFSCPLPTLPLSSHHHAPILMVSPASTPFLSFREMRRSLLPQPPAQVSLAPLRPWALKLPPKKTDFYHQSSDPVPPNDCCLPQIPLSPASSFPLPSVLRFSETAFSFSNSTNCFSLISKRLHIPCMKIGK